MGIPCLLKHTETQPCTHPDLGMHHLFYLLTSMVNVYQQRPGIYLVPDRRLELDRHDVTDLCLVYPQPEMDGYQ